MTCWPSCRKKTCTPRAKEESRRETAEKAVFFRRNPHSNIGFSPDARRRRLTQTMRGGLRLIDPVIPAQRARYAGKNPGLWACVGPNSPPR